MKTWEVFKLILENPSKPCMPNHLNFKRLSNGRIYQVGLSNGKQWLFREDENEDREVVIVYVEEDWELVREPVDFMTAVNSDKRISSEDGVIILCYPGALVRNGWLTIGQINGKWLIE